MTGDHVIVCREGGWFALDGGREFGPFATEVDCLFAADRRLGVGRQAEHYRIYRLNADDAIIGAEWIEAPDDESACRRARELCGDGRRKVEVWRRTRRIAVLP